MPRTRTKNEEKQNMTREEKTMKATPEHVAQLMDAGLWKIREILEGAIDRKNDLFPVAKAAQDYFLKYGFSCNMRRHLASIDADTVRKDIDKMDFLNDCYNYNKFGIEELEKELVEILSKYTPYITVLSDASNTYPFMRTGDPTAKNESNE